MSSVLDDFIVRLGFKVEQDQLAKFKNSLSGIRKLAPVAVMGAFANELLRASKEAKELVNITTHTNTSITGLSSLERVFYRITNSAEGARGAVESLSRTFKEADPKSLGAAISKAFPGVQSFDKNGKLRDMSMIIRDISESAQKMKRSEAYFKLENLGFSKGTIDALLDKRFVKQFDEIYKEQYKLSEELEKNAARMEKVANSWERIINTLKTGTNNGLAEFLGITQIEDFIDRFSIWLTEQYPLSIKRFNSFIAGWMPGQKYWQTVERFMDWTAKTAKTAVNAPLEHTRAPVYDMATWDDARIKKEAEENNQPEEEVRLEVERAKRLVAEWKKQEDERAKKAADTSRQSKSLLEKISDYTSSIPAFTGLFTPAQAGGVPAGGVQGGGPGAAQTPVPAGQAPRGGVPIPTGATGPARAFAPGAREERVREAYAVLKEEGFTDEAAAGGIGVLLAESNLDPTAKRAGGTDTGVAQWIANRQPKFWQTYEEINGKGSAAKFGGDIRNVPMRDQIKVWVRERPEITKRMKNARTVEEATYFALMGYENGSGKDLATVEAVNKAYKPFGYGFDEMYTRRLSLAGRAYKTIKAPPRAQKPAAPAAPAPGKPVAASGGPSESYMPPERADIMGVLAYALKRNREDAKGAADKPAAGNTVSIQNVFNGPADPAKVQEAVEVAIEEAGRKAGSRYSRAANWA